MADWDKMREEYTAGGTSYRKLAERYGIPYATLATRAGKEKWTELKGEHMFLSRPVSAEACVSSAVESLADKLLARVSELIDVMVLDTHGVKQLASALKDLRDIKESQAEFALKIAKLRKLEQEIDAERGADVIEVVFEAGKEAWNE